MRWTLGVILQVLLLFLLAAVCEIGGGWLVWQAVRESKPAWWAAAGSLVLVLYGFSVTLQPVEEFGRLYAVYGGLFIACSLAWGKVCAVCVLYVLCHVCCMSCIRIYTRYVPRVFSMPLVLCSIC